MSKIVNLTPAILRRIISEEKARLRVEAKSKKAKTTGAPKDLSKVQAREVGPSELADTIADKVEHYKNLKTEAAKLARRLSKLNEARQALREEILEDI
jgi:hypothetical protein